MVDARTELLCSEELAGNIHRSVDHEDFLSRIGLSNFDRLRIRDTYSTPVNYGGRE